MEVSKSTSEVTGCFVAIAQALLNLTREATMGLNAHGNTTDCSQGFSILACWLPPSTRGPAQSHLLCKLGNSRPWTLAEATASASPTSRPLSTGARKGGRTSPTREMTDPALIVP